MGVGIKIKSKGARESIAKLVDGFPQTMTKAVIKAALHVESETKKEIYETFPDGRTGALARSFHPVFIGREGNTVSAVVRSELVYARIQDEGGTIKPKGRFLAVPLPNVRLPVGKWPRDFNPPLTLIPRKGKPSLLVKITGLRKNFIGPQMGKKWTPLFVLVRSVTLRGRGYVNRAALRSEPGVEAILGGFVDEAIKSSEGGSGGAE